jgi:hypothetical protein
LNSLEDGLLALDSFGERSGTRSRGGSGDTGCSVTLLSGVAGGGETSGGSQSVHFGHDLLELSGNFGRKLSGGSTGHSVIGWGNGTSSRIHTIVILAELGDVPAEGSHLFLDLEGLGANTSGALGHLGRGSLALAGFDNASLDGFDAVLTSNLFTKLGDALGAIASRGSLAFSEDLASLVLAVCFEDFDFFLVASASFRSLGKRTIFVAKVLAPAVGITSSPFGLRLVGSQNSGLDVFLRSHSVFSIGGFVVLTKGSPDQCAHLYETVGFCLPYS